MIFQIKKRVSSVGFLSILILSIALFSGCNANNRDVALERGTTTEGASSSTGSGPYADIPVGFTEEGYPYRGDPDAPVTVYEYSDYLCPFCGRHNNETMPILLDEFARTGKVKFVFLDFPIEALHPTADYGHLAAMCVAEQDAAEFWEMHDLLYARQNQWNGLPNPAEYVVGLAQEVGADMKVFEICFNDQGTVDILNGRIADARELGFNGTPSFNFRYKGNDELYPYVGAQPASEFSRIFYSLASIGKLPLDPTPEPQVLPYWLTDDGLAPDPMREGFTKAGDPFKGDPSAELVVIELTDFQCPSCATHSLQIQPFIDEQLVDTGRVRWILKNLPVKEHQRAPVAAAAAECAADQGQYWAMHDQLFKNQSAWSTSDNDTFFLEIAEDLDMNLTEFAACLTGRAALESVIHDLFDAQQAGLYKTPTFIIVHDDVPTLLEGSREVSEFVSLLESFLTKAPDSE